MINNPNFGVHEECGYSDLFEDCKRLIEISAELNMTLVEYFRHLAQIKGDRIRLRWMLICLKRINAKRISHSEEGVAKKRKLSDGVGSSSSSYSWVVLRRSYRIGE